MTNIVEVVIRANDETKKPLTEAERRFTEFSKAATQASKEYMSVEKQKTAALREAEKNQAAAFKSIAAGAAVAAAAIIKFGADAYNTYQDYAQSVRDLASISGTGAEESSKLLQVLDDYQISAEQVTAATRFMTNAGLTPTIETLAKLSDQYLAIQDPMERNEFVLKNLGRGGMQWVNVLKQGSKALKESEDGINQNLILSDEQIKAAEEQRLAMDALSDSWEGFKVAVGGAIGNQILAIQNTKEHAKAVGEYARAQGMVINNQRTAREANEAYEESLAATGYAEERAAMMGEYWEKQLGETTGAMDEALPTVENLSKVYKEYLDLIGTISDEEESHGDKMADLNGQLEEAETKLADMTKTRWWDVAAIEEQKGKIDELKQKMSEETADFEENTRRRILSMLEEKLSIDGLSEAETQYLEDLGVKWGVYSESAIESARAARAEVDALLVAFNSLPSEKSISINLRGGGEASYTAAALATASGKDAYMQGGKGGKIGYSSGTEGWMTVPQGYPNDTYPVMVSSGERFAVVANGQGAQPAAGGGGGSNRVVIDEMSIDKLVGRLETALQRLA